MSRSIVLWIAVATLLCVASSAQAGIYKCVGPDGRVTFTSDPGSCPNAKPHVLKARVQTVIDSSTSEAARARSAARAAAARSGGEGRDELEKMWRRKRGETQAKLQQVERSWTQLQSMIKGCNRGGEWFRKDEAGIRQHVPCGELQTRRQAIEKERDDLTEYLRIGIEDDCRRAGCIPGWIRSR